MRVLMDSEKKGFMQKVKDFFKGPTCKLPGCDKEVYDDYMHYFEYCCRAHAQQVVLVCLPA